MENNFVGNVGSASSTVSSSSSATSEDIDPEVFALLPPEIQVCFAFFVFYHCL